MSIDAQAWLRDLIHPLSPEDFARDLGRRSISLKGEPTKFSALFDRARFDQALSRLGREGDDAQTLRACMGKGQCISITPNQVQPLYDLGATICVTEIHRWDEGLNLLVAGVKAALGWAGRAGMNCYLSPNGSGLQAHYDARHVTTLQLEGSKRWKFSREPAVPVPLVNATVLADGTVAHAGRNPGDVAAWEQVEAPDEGTFLETTLEPGDLLSLPAGVWHCAEANGHSLALNFYFQDTSPFDLLMDVLRAQLMKEERWRRGLQPALSTTTAAAGLPAALQAQISELVHSLGQAVSALSPNTPAVESQWRQSVARFDAIAAGPKPSKEAPLAREQRLRVSPMPVLLSLAAFPASEVTLYRGDSSLTLPGSLRAFIETVLDKDAFSGTDAARWIGLEKDNDWPLVASVLEQLEGLGVLERAP